MDTFDYIFYNYGMNHVQHPDRAVGDKGKARSGDFVIVIDTTHILGRELEYRSSGGDLQRAQ